MLSKLAKRNAKRSMRDYLVYMLTMVLITALIFAFNSHDLFKIRQDLVQPCIRVMIIMLSMASVFVVCITAWLVNYMVRFMADKRSREFATYLLLGFRKKQIANLFMKENMLIGLGAFFYRSCSGTVPAAGDDYADLRHCSPGVYPSAGDQSLDLSADCGNLSCVLSAGPGSKPQAF